MQWDKEAKAHALIPTLPLHCVDLFPPLSLFLHLNQGFSTSALLMIWARSFVVEQCRLFSGIPDLYPPETNSIPPLPSPAVTTKNVPQTLPNVPKRQNHPWLSLMMFSVFSLIFWDSP